MKLIKTKDAYSWVLDDDGNRMLWSVLYADCDMVRMELEAEVKRLRGITMEAYMKLHGDVLKEVGPILLRDRVTKGVVASDSAER